MFPVAFQFDSQLTTNAMVIFINAYKRSSFIIQKAEANEIDSTNQIRTSSDFNKWY